MRHFTPKIISGLGLVVLVMLSGGTTQAQTPTSTEPFKIQVMKHVCPTVRGASDFNALTAGKDTLSAFLALELACPTTALPGDDAPANATSAPRMSFEFNVSGEDDMIQILSDADYIQDTLCETDISSTTDFDNNGTASSTACLDASYYEFMVDRASTSTSTSSLVFVKETDPGDDHHLGTILFTPDEIVFNDDADTFVSGTFSTSTGTTTSPNSSQNSGGSITLDMSEDDDGMVMLHVFNFADATSTATSTDDDKDDGDGDNDSVIDRINERLDEAQARIAERLHEVQERLQDIQDGLTDRF